MIVNGLRLYFLAVHIATTPPPSFHFNMPIFHVSLVSQFPQVFFVHLIWKRTLEASGIGNMESQHKRSTSSSIWIFEARPIGWGQFYCFIVFFQCFDAVELGS